MGGNLAKVLGENDLQGGITLPVKSKTAAITAASFCFDKQVINVSLIGWKGVHCCVILAQRSQKF